MTTDANDKLKDAIPVGQDSEGKGQKDSAQPKIYTEDESEAKFSQQRSVLDKKIAVLEKTVESSKGKDTEISDLKKRITQMEEAEEERYRDEPDKLAEFRERRKNKDRDAELARVTQERDEEREKGKQRDVEAAQTTLEVNAWEVAKRLDVDALTLLKLVKFTDGSKEAIEAIAQGLPKKGETKTLKTDSGKTIGDGDDLSSLPPKERVKEADRRLREK